MSSPSQRPAAPRIVVINPNSNAEVTAGIDRAVEPFRAAGVSIACETLAEGPFGIESQRDADAVTLPLANRVTRSDAEAWVIACYSDPGVHVCREAASAPVFGIAECAVLSALARAERFGVIAIKDGSIRRHLRQLRELGLIGRLAAERALNMSVAETASGTGTLERMVVVGEALRDQDGAGAVIMGCAGMARHRRPLEDALGVPVIEPCQAAVTLAIGTLLG
ncbi:MAG: aspartate/glutamate racemase family protein [Pseudomonadota bacterium]